MATNNSNNLGRSAHPDDLMELFALDALDLDEEQRVQDHLDGCDPCSDIVDQYHGTAAELARSVITHEPPAALRAQVMQAIS